MMVVEWLVEADFAHFSHPATGYSSLTYPVPPKTAVMGMLGAIAGMDEIIALNDMKYSLCVESMDGKKSFCFNGIKDALMTLDPKKMLNPKKDKDFGVKKRKQFYRELLVNPKYRIFCDLSGINMDVRERVVEAMKKKRSVYPLYLGVNFCLADYELVALHENSPEQTFFGKAEIDSIIPLEYDFEIEERKQYNDVRMPTKVDRERHFGAFRDYMVETSGKTIVCNNAKFHEIGNKKIVWS